VWGVIVACGLLPVFGFNVTKFSFQKAQPPSIIASSEHRSRSRLEKEYIARIMLKKSWKYLAAYCLQLTAYSLQWSEREKINCTQFFLIRKSPIAN
jgi:hypothetical protein